MPGPLFSLNQDLILRVWVHQLQDKPWSQDIRANTNFIAVNLFESIIIFCCCEVFYSTYISIKDLQEPNMKNKNGDFSSLEIGS